MWNKIVNPTNGRKVNLNSKMGKSILRNYIKQIGGADGLVLIHCPICLEDMNPQEILIKCHNEEEPNLSHLYHPKCIYRVRDCPLCRVECGFFNNTIQGYAIFTDASVPLMKTIINRYYNGDILPPNDTTFLYNRIHIRLSNELDNDVMCNGTRERPYTFPLNINNWDVSNVKDMSEMFEGANNFNQPIGKWRVSKVENMRGMFYITNIPIIDI